MKTKELVIIDAIKFSRGITSMAALIKFAGKAVSIQNNNGHTWAMLKNRDGRKFRVEMGDWIMKFSNGNFGMSYTNCRGSLIFA